MVMSYRSANFDEEVFEDPHTFNILRDPNPHVGFGGTGAHYCIGANLARMTINLIFNAVADHMPDLKPIGEPERLRSGWLNGIKHWQVDYTGTVRLSRLTDQSQANQGGFGWTSVQTKGSRPSPTSSPRCSSGTTAGTRWSPAA